MQYSCAVRGSVINFARLVLPALFLLWIQSGCSGPGAGPAGNANVETQHAASGFAINVLPESFSVDPAGEPASARLSISTSAAGHALQLEVRADDARALKALYFELEYDADTYRPLGAAATDLLGPVDQQLILSVLGEAGRVHFGQLLLRPQEQQGFSGSGVLARITFERRPCTAQLRAVSAAPSSDASRTSLALDIETLTLGWRYFSSGDYFQNGEVNIADLTPLGQHLNESSAPLPRFPPELVESVIDGDGNGLLNISDLTPIGANFGNRVLSYNIYASGNFSDIPSANTAPSTIDPLGFVNFAAAEGDSAADRLSFSFALGEAKLGWFYWVRPCDAADGAGNEGTPSTLVSFGGSEGGSDPVAAISVDPGGGDVPLTVSLDASDSSDSDGSIVQFAWDFEGDGSIDQVGSEAQTTHLYTTGGLFEPTVFVTDDSAAGDSASTLLNLQNPDNQPPSVQLSADPQESGAPVLVTFSAAAFDPDGSIARFDWDEDDDGVFETTTGLDPQLQIGYASEGSFDVAVRVTDNEGATDESVTQVTIAGVAENTAPVLVVVPDKLEGDVPLTFQLDLSQTSDPQGNLALVELTKNGTFFGSLFPEELDNPMQIELSAAQVLTIEITASDSFGLTDSETIELRGLENGNLPPLPDFTANPGSGDAPLQVGLDATASVDLDGSITKFEWDFDFLNEEGFTLDEDSGAVAQTSHVYEESDAGSRTIALRVTDDGGLQRQTLRSVGVTDPTNDPPLAAFDPELSEGPAPLELTFDASASSDPDDSIVLFEWDFGGDGVFESSSGNQPQISYTFGTQGNHQVVLRVTDERGATDVAEGTVEVTGGWQLVVAAPSLLGGGQTCAADLRSGIGGLTHRLGISCYNQPFGVLHFVRSSDTSPLDFDPLRQVAFGGDGEENSLFTVSSRPAIAFTKSDSDSEGAYFYIRADDSTGEDWGDEVLVHDFPLSFDNHMISLHVQDGRPSVLFTATNGLDYSRAEDALGSSWAPRDSVASALSFPQSTVFTVQGFPAAVFFSRTSGQQLKYSRASNAQGSLWPAPLLLDASARESRPDLTLVGGFPAVAYSDAPLSYIRASDINGDSWPASTELASGLQQTAEFVNLTFFGSPAICYFNSAGGANDLMVLFAEDANGTAWGEPHFVDSLGDVGSGASMITYQGHFVISYYDRTEFELKVAVLDVQP